MENYNLNVASQDGVLTILTGKALEQKEPERIIIVGDIKTVANFLRIRLEKGAGMQEIDKSKAVVTVEKANLSLSLDLDPQNFYGAQISGVLEKAPELIPFHINQNKTFSKEELVKLLKFNKLYFESAEKHAEMLLAFQKVQSTVNIRNNDSSDDRGNKERAFVKEVTTNAPTEFILSMPIFKGFPAVRFRVEICLDVTEGSARFWFESVELHEIMQREVEVIFSEELKICEGFVIVNK